MAETKISSQERVRPLVESITQREKFLLADRLSRPFSEIMEDPDRIMLALAWVKRKRENGGKAPSFDELLDMTDQQLLDVLELRDDDDQESGDPKSV